MCTVSHSNMNIISAACCQSALTMPICPCCQPASVGVLLDHTHMISNAE